MNNPEQLYDLAAEHICPEAETLLDARENNTPNHEQAAVRFVNFLVSRGVIGFDERDYLLGRTETVDPITAIIQEGDRNLADIPEDGLYDDPLDEGMGDSED